MAPESQMSKTMLTVYRVAFACGLAFILLVSKRPLPLSDEIVFLAAMLVILVGLWWKKIYSNPAFGQLIAPFVIFTMFIASWIRHGPFTAAYGMLCLVFPVMWLPLRFL